MSQFLNLERKLKILIIEDNELDLHIIQLKLVQTGITTQDELLYATRLSRAVEMLEENPCDIVLLDLDIVDSHGISTFEKLKNRVDNVPIIVLSGLYNAEIAKLAVQLGAQDYIDKNLLSTTDISRTICFSIERFKMLAKIKKYSEYKNQFLAQMSHEIRTPLNGVIGLAESLKRDSSLASEHADIIDLILNCGQHLIELTSDILDLDRAEKSNSYTDFEETEVRPFIEKLINLYSPKAVERRNTLASYFSTSVPQYLSIDKRAVSQVTTNLISNALKFTDNGQVVIYVMYCSADGKLRISVKDNGMGIPIDKQRKIFSAYCHFSDEEIYNNHTRSSGLGLSICKSIIKKVEGKIGFFSRENKGSDFWFEVPSQGRQVIAEERLKHIILIGKYPNRRKILQKQLEEHAIRVTELSIENSGLCSSLEEPDSIILVDRLDIDSRFLNELFAKKGKQKVLLICENFLSNSELNFKPNIYKGSLLQNKILHKLRETQKNQGAVHRKGASACSKEKLNYKVLVADDNEVNIIVLGKMLKYLGCECLEVNNGLEAYEKLKEDDAIDLILMDLKMPVWDGIKATQEIRKLDSGKGDVPIIALTASVFEEDRRKCRDVGMSGFLSKPLVLNSLRRCLLKTLDGQPSQKIVEV